MSSLSPTIRSIMWNIYIYIHTFKQTIVKPTRADAIAGFICSNGLSISTRTIFEDLKIIYPSLHDYPSLTLWREPDDDGFVEFINSADEDREFEFKKPTSNLRLCLGLIVHDTNHPDAQKYQFSNLIPKRMDICPMSRAITSLRRRNHTSSEDSASRPATPGSDELRQREEQESREFARNNFDIDPKSFERSVKYAYTECLIARTNSRCSPPTMRSRVCSYPYGTADFVVFLPR
ncbi:hypothetical protein TWF106_009061 [Orbilia oligospora]|uniref:Uncharacterized protein n=1 Tax=Orbilia oligospora TaxID=2813651 RepID=A0A6G1LVY3_ORBOL|nr:hypothetical protein TWF106_009061 [Orbilia oligospora]KAF3224935.1 hypothetical protein TWF191_005783 [Orbilia oligospora]KAF3236322.1 hypothetical protein TWF192_011457 [Orbilia oligospora]